MFAAILFNGFSAWWVLLCLLTGLLYAFVFYSTQKRDTLYYVLFALRTILITFLCFLLLAPLLQLQKEQEEKPLIIIAQDNSASVPLSSAKNFDLTGYKNRLKNLEKDLGSKYDTELLNFGATISKAATPDFSQQQTDISQLFSYIQDQYGNRNIGAVIIASDGIINKGNSGSQQASVFKAPVYTIALGDTTAGKDLLIRNINYNRIAYLDNKYPVEVNLSAYQARGKTASINIESTDGQRKSQTFTIDSDDWKKNFSFHLDAKKTGIQKIKISVSDIGEEVSLQNNQQTIYIEVLDGKQKILLLANAPHPDLNAIKQSLDGNKNYDTEIFLANEAPKNTAPYDVIILHNLPSANFPLREFLGTNTNKPLWFIVGTASNIVHLNQAQTIVQISSNNLQQDYYPQLNKDFFNFSVSEDVADFIRNLAPLTGPFGKYTSNGDLQYLLSQRIGTLNTSQPLLGFVKKNNLNNAFLSGEGIWRWRLENYRRAENFNAFDELITKTVQYLSVKEDKRKFRAYPAKNRFTEDENIILNAELYDDAYQPVENAEISIELKNEEGRKFSYLFSKKDKFYELNAGYLPAGEYSFAAQTNFGGKKQESRGSFLIEKLHAEYANTTANHQLLYNLSALSGGKLFYPSEMDKLAQELETNEKITTIVHTDNTYEDLINLKWIFAILMLLLSAEWFVRKRNGLL